MVQYLPLLDITFAALSDGTRRSILERLGKRGASISELAADSGMTLTGIKKHVQILEDAGLVVTKKTGRVRQCRLGSRRLDAESAWIGRFQEMLESRLDSLGKFLDQTRER